MQLWATFNLASLLAGLLIGAVLAFLLRLRSLKRLDLDVRRIGVNLGIEGFEERSTGFTIGGNVGGDVAGRDMSKYYTDQSRNLFNVLRSLAGDRSTKAVSFCKTEAKLDNQLVVYSLKRLVGSSDDWLVHYYEDCLECPDLIEKINAKTKELKRQEWDIRNIRLIDNSQEVFCLSLS